MRDTGAGAQCLQVFESVGAEVLTQAYFYEFAFTYLAQIAARVKDACPDTPLIGFSKGNDDNPLSGVTYLC